MTIQANKIIKYILLLALAAIIAGLGYYFSGKQRLLTGNILAAVSSPDVFKNVEFANPIGVAYPIDNVVSIDSVLVDFRDCGAISGGVACAQTPGCTWTSPNCTGTSVDGFASGNDIVGSLVYFTAETVTNCTSSAACPITQGCQVDTTCKKIPNGGASISGNKINVEGINYDIKVDIYVPDRSTDTDSFPDKVNTQSLIISPPDCSSLQTSIMKGQGTGIFTGNPDDLPTAATSRPFEFDRVSEDGEGVSAVSNINLSDFYKPNRNLSQIVIENPVATGTTLGSKQFTLTVNFLTAIPDTATDTPTYDIGTCNMNTSSNCTIIVKEDTTTVATTAANFAAAINAIPFRAFTAAVGSPNTVVSLTATEIGSHTNNYIATATMANTTTAYCTSSLATCNTEPLDICELNASICKSKCLLHTEEQCLADENCDFNTTSGCIVKDPVVVTNFTPFTGGEDPVYNPVQSIILSYPTTTVTGAQTFNMTMNFEAGLPQNAAIASSSGDGNYTINVRDEGVSDTAGTASNFAYVFNHLLGANSPFAASIDPTNSSWIVLNTRELGTHTNDYICNVDGIAFTNSAYLAPGDAGKCFAGGKAGTDGVDVLTTPLTLDNKMNQGDTSMVYITGSTGENTWTSSHPSVLEVALLSDVAQGASTSSAQFLNATLNTTGYTYDLNSGTYTISPCVPEYSDDATPILIKTTCDIAMSIPVSFPAPTGLEALVNVGGESIPVTLTADANLTGIITGSGTWSSDSTAGGFNQTLTGTITGTVTGYAAAPYEGMVHGTIKANVSANAQLLFSATLSNLGITLFPGMGAPSATSQLTADGTFTSTVTKVESIITNQAVLYAKRPGTSILTVTDSQNCTAALEVQVIGQKVILQMVDKDPSEVFDVGENVQINAYRGTSEGETIEDITANPGITWASSNQAVATIDATGILTAIAPGVTNITAKYTATGETEIGQIISDPLTIKVNKIADLTIGLDEATQALLPSDVKNKAYESVLFIVHDPAIAGRKVTVEGTPIDIILPDSDYANNLEKVSAIATDLQTKINTQFSTTVKVSRIVDLPGVLVLEKKGTNPYIDISTTATQGQATIVPNFSESINLPANQTFGLMVIAAYDNGRTKRLAPTAVTWVNTPVNYLDTALLPTGKLKLGEVAGQSTVQATYKNADNSSVASNVLNVTVQSGPVIESIIRVGSGPITKNSQVNLRVKVTDVDTITDIQDIEISVVKSAFSNYNEILADSGAVWYTVTTYPELIEVVDQGTEGGTTPPAPAVPALNFRTYNLPVQIPNDENLFDGPYKLVISITDAASHTINYVYPISIGEMASGDVNGDGVVNMIDVILAYQIAAGNITPTEAQLQVANMDGIGGVTMIDVILLFQQVAAS